MMTIVTHVTLKDGAAASQWDAAMRQRLTAARDQRGWVGGQLLVPVDASNKRVIVGTWETRAEWQAWHDDPTFRETRDQLDGLEAAPAQHWWHEVVVAGGSTDRSLDAAA